MRVEPCPVGARVIDSLPFSQGGTATQAKALKATGIDGIVGYLGVIDAERLGFILDAGLGFWAVTLAGHYDGGQTVQALRALGVPPGMSAFLDLEGLAAFHTEPAALESKIDAWADTVATGRFLPGLYVGVPQPFTSDELWNLRVSRYWRGQGSVRDRMNNLAEPTGCGWAVTQMYPSILRAQVLVDVNVVGQDYKGRVPAWCVAD